ncbi:hypothetical protein L2719_13370 [Shewanella schlegeliana]|uniref:Uncharacterized protein n=1 Tax=Shewanella schlegeliana TaxID=190308 RepID=A0ABS1T6D9_9GAMM|nr:hypothetical protein [Shewanella schlegeliana]MBL4915051.1 hypothetical protein [Shewanella schlegeliana]MCL1110537.1 hypothetical protein [Shewanella schlegeliana]GIU32410.1 hypothetical protein TUM4433_25360 [Shewanella schlegeliana]
MKGLTQNRAVIKSAAILALATSAIAALALSSAPVETTSTLACACDSTNSQYNPSLPASHPSNRCANQSHDLSWKSWLTGKSQTNQLHFIDLFELLYGHESAPISKNTPLNGK